MQIPSLSSFYVIGVSYHKSDASIRSRFAVAPPQLEKLFANAGIYTGVYEFFVLSTCNRTEIYGFANGKESLKSLLCSVTEGNEDELNDIAYSKEGHLAIQHLFNVAAGLDSQILGDYEITGQLRRAMLHAKEKGFVHITLERLVNETVRATREVRTHTEFSSGTVSVSFAAVQFLKQYFQRSEQLTIVLVGTGKIGVNTCKNLVDQLPESNITLVNRTNSKARELAESFGLHYADIKDLPLICDKADAILVATSAETPVIFPYFFESNRSRLIIDFSIPCNVDAHVKTMAGINLVGIDDLSKIKDETLQRRAAEVPKVEKIISSAIDEFFNWYDMRHHVPLLKAVKNKLISIQGNEKDKNASMRIQKVINGVAVKMKTHNNPGCHYIEAINDFLSPTLDNS